MADETPTSGQEAHQLAEELTTLGRQGPDGDLDGALDALPGAEAATGGAGNGLEVIQTGQRGLEEVGGQVELTTGVTVDGEVVPSETIAASSSDGTIEPIVLEGGGEDARSDNGGGRPAPASPSEAAATGGSSTPPPAVADAPAPIPDGNLGVAGGPATAAALTGGAAGGGGGAAGGAGPAGPADTLEPESLDATAEAAPEAEGADGGGSDGDPGAPPASVAAPGNVPAATPTPSPGAVPGPVAPGLVAPGLAAPGTGAPGLATQGSLDGADDDNAPPVNQLPGEIAGAEDTALAVAGIAVSDINGGQLTTAPAMAISPTRTASSSTSRR